MYDLKTDEDLARAAQAKDKGAESALIARYWDLSGILANAFPIRGYDHDDRQAEALAGLLRAVRRYEDGRGTKFKTFAKRLMLNALRDLHRAAHAVGEVPPSALRSLDAPLGDDDGDLSLADMVAGDDDELGGIMDRDDVRTRWAAARESAWDALVDAIFGEGDLTGLKALLAFARAAMPGQTHADLQGLATGQESLEGGASVRESDEAWDMARKVFDTYTDAQRLILEGIGQGYDYTELAAALTIRFHGSFPGLRIRPDLVGALVRDMRERAGIQEEATPERPQAAAPAVRRTRAPKAQEDTLGLFAEAA